MFIDILLGTCRNSKCKKRYFYAYEEYLEDETEIRKFYFPEQYFSCTREIFFETKFLEYLVGLFSLSSVDFQSFVDSYNHSFSTPGQTGMSIKHLGT